MTTTIAIIVSLIVGAILGRSMVSTKTVTITRTPDIKRLDYLETTKQSVFYNDIAQAWAVLTADGKPIKAARDMRAAIDHARARSNG